MMLMNKMMSIKAASNSVCWGGIDHFDQIYHSVGHLKQLYLFIVTYEIILYKIRDYQLLVTF